MHPLRSRNHKAPNCSPDLGNNEQIPHFCHISVAPIVLIKLRCNCVSTPFQDTHLGRLRAVVGSRLLLLPTATVVVQRDDGQVLLQHRRDFQVWGLPGGYPEENERLRDLVVRETAEETGVLISDPRPFAFSDNPEFEKHLYPGGDRCHTFNLVFFSRSFSGELRASDPETLSVGWFALDELPPMMSNMARILDAYQDFLVTGEFQVV